MSLRAAASAQDGKPLKTVLKILKQPDDRLRHVAGSRTGLTSQLAATRAPVQNLRKAFVDAGAEHPHDLLRRLVETTCRITRNQSEFLGPMVAGSQKREPPSGRCRQTDDHPLLPWNGDRREGEQAPARRRDLCVERRTV